MIRIIHYIGSLESGGSQAMIMNIYRNIDRSEIQFDFVIHDKKNKFYKAEIEKLGGKIYVCPSYNGKNHFSYNRWWNSFFTRHEEYHVFHCHVRSTSYICINSAKQHGLVTIAHSHSTSNGTGFSGKIKDIMQYPTRYVADYFFACSKDAGEWMFGKKVISSKRFRVLNNSIDAKKYIYTPEKRARFRNELGLSDKFVVGHVGRFMEAKNHTFLIDVFNELQKTKPDSVLLLVGDGPLKKEIERKVHMLHLDDKVIFLGVRDDVLDLLQVMDVFVFPSTYEGLGIVAVEAQASGLPTICSSEVPKEAKVTSLFKSVPLKKGAEYWASRVLMYEKGYNRKDTFNDIKSVGYDIIDNSKYIEKFYLEQIPK